MGRPPKKYNWTNVSRKYDNFEITESDWKRIESRCGYRFNASTRDHIRDATRYFLTTAEGERIAPRMYPQGGKAPKRNAAEERVWKIKRSAKALEDVLRVPGSADAPEFEADHLIMMHCQELPELCGSALSRSAVGRRKAALLLADLLSRFLAACNKAECDLKLFKNAEFFKDGDAWNEWILSLGRLLKELSLDIRASLKHSNQRYPPFVRLIKALQELLLQLHEPSPQESIQQRSNEALAKAIQRALRGAPQDS